MIVTMTYLIAAAAAGWTPEWHLMVITGIIDVVLLFAVFGSDNEPEEDLALDADDLENSEEG